MYLAHNNCVQQLRKLYLSSAFVFNSYDDKCFSISTKNK